MRLAGIEEFQERAVVSDGAPEEAGPGCSDVIVDRSAVFDAVEGDLSLFVVNPQEDAIVADPVFLDPLEVFGWVLKGNLRASG